MYSLNNRKAYLVNQADVSIVIPIFWDFQHNFVVNERHDAEPNVSEVP